MLSVPPLVVVTPSQVFEVTNTNDFFTATSWKATHDQCFERHIQDILTPRNFEDPKVPFHSPHLALNFFFFLYGLVFRFVVFSF